MLCASIKDVQVTKEIIQYFKQEISNKISPCWLFFPSWIRILIPSPAYAIFF